MYIGKEQCCIRCGKIFYHRQPRWICDECFNTLLTEQTLKRNKKKEEEK